MYWEFRKAGKKYQAIVDIDHPTYWPDEEMLAHSISIIDDLPCRPKKIFLEALKPSQPISHYAESNNIILMELPKPGERPRIPGHTVYNFNIDIFQPHIRIAAFNQDEEWNRKELERLKVPLKEASKIGAEISDETKFYDENGKAITTAFLLSNSLVPKGFQEMPPKIIRYQFKTPTFIETNDARVRRLKVKSIDFEISKTHENVRFEMDVIDFVNNIIEKTTGSNINLSILDELMRTNPNIVGYSSTLKDELVNGKPSGRKAIRIYVVKKKPKSRLPRDQILPDVLEGYPVDVMEVGRPKLLQSSTTPTEHIRPLVGGISIGKNDPLHNGAGTLGYFVKDHEGHWFALSCQHVFGEVLDTSIIQPGNCDAGRYPEDHVAKLSRSVSNNFVDAAIARLDILAMPQMNGLPSPTGIRMAEEQMQVIKSGRTTRVTYGDVVDTTAACQMSDGRILKDQILIMSNLRDPFSRPGDSGSVIIDQNTNEVIGLLFGGDESVGSNYANHITDVLDALGVQIVDSGDNFQ